MAFKPKAQLVSGNPITRDYNNGTNAVAAGDVVVVNNSLGVAIQDIPASGTGTLSVGGAVYDFIFGGSNGAGVAVSDGNLVRWDSTNLFAVGGTIAANLKLGAAVGAATTNSASIRVHFMPGLNI